MKPENGINHLKNMNARIAKGIERRRVFSKYFKNGRDEGQFDKACRALETGLGYSEEDFNNIKELLKFDERVQLDVIRSFLSHEEVDEIIAGLGCTQSECGLSQNEMKFISSISLKLEKLYE